MKNSENETSGSGEPESGELESGHSTRLELAPEADFPAVEQKKGFWKKLKRGLLMTHTEIIERVEAAFDGRAVLDESALEYLEESLIASDLGVETALELVEKVRAEARPEDAKDPSRLRQILADEIAAMLVAASPDGDGSGAGDAHPMLETPTVTLVVGVNGAGKTTSIAKLTRWLQHRDRRVLLAAGDTFRAAAIEQLALWGERLGADVIRQKAGGDPAAVVYDALHAGRARSADQVLVDTAGRLHNKEHLMQELAKIRRVIDREAPERRKRTVLVVDATTGQNALAQAREFAKVSAVDGVLLTKLDGTAKGGMAVAIARDLGLPVWFLGVGETPEDLVEFRPREFATALVG